jgi:hypothetical protein
MVATLTDRHLYTVLVLIKRHGKADPRRSLEDPVGD